MTCVDAVCALAPFALRVVTPDIDPSSYEVYRDYANSLQGITVEAVSVRLTGVNPGRSVGPLDLGSGALPAAQVHLAVTLLLQVHRSL